MELRTNFQTMLRKRPLRCQPRRRRPPGSSPPPRSPSRPLCHHRRSSPPPRSASRLCRLRSRRWRQRRRQSRCRRRVWLLHRMMRTTRRLTSTAPLCRPCRRSPRRRPSRWRQHLSLWQSPYLWQQRRSPQRRPSRSQHRRHGGLRHCQHLPERRCHLCSSSSSLQTCWQADRQQCSHHTRPLQACRRKRSRLWRSRQPLRPPAATLLGSPHQVEQPWALAPARRPSLGRPPLHAAPDLQCAGCRGRGRRAVRPSAPADLALAAPALLCLQVGS